MATAQKTCSVLKRFARNQAGATAVVFALSVVPMLLAGGTAIDYVRYANAETRLQASVDAAALAIATAGNLPQSDRIAAGKSTFEFDVARAGADISSIKSSFNLSGGSVAASASFELPAGFMQIAGFSALKIEAATEIRIPDDQKAEIALVLDYSGSMREKLGGQVKYVAMKNAAKRLISDLEASNPKKVKVGLVPFYTTSMSRYPRPMSWGNRVQVIGPAAPRTASRPITSPAQRPC